MKKAFSLAELLIVLAVISIITGTMKVHIQHKRIQAEAKNIVECVKVYEAAITMYYLRHGGKFPPNSRYKKLEDVEALKPYIPDGFNTMDSINSKLIRYIDIYDQWDKYGIRINNWGGEGEVLLREVEQQLKKFAVENQVVYKANVAIGSGAGGTIELNLYFYLKDGDNIYI